MSSYCCKHPALGDGHTRQFEEHILCRQNNTYANGSSLNVAEYKPTTIIKRNLLHCVFNKAFLNYEMYKSYNKMLLYATFAKQLYALVVAIN